MKRKNIALISAFCGLALILPLYFLSNSSQKIAHGVDCNWNHYQQVEATKTNAGCKEYWVCCSHHEVVLEKPSNGTINNAGKQTTAFANSLSDSDERKILSFDSAASKLNNAIANLPSEANLTFDNLKDINSIIYTYNEMNEETKSYVSNWNSFKTAKTYFYAKYPALFNANTDSFQNREYLSSTYDLERKCDKEIGEYARLSSIKGSDTFWITPNKSIELNDYEKTYIYLRCSNDITLEFRSKFNYSKEFTIPLKSNTWSLITINFKDYDISNLSDLGFALWKGSSFNYNFTLDISSIYGVSSNQSFDAIQLFDATTDSLKYINYKSTYNVKRGYDNTIKDDYIELSNISNTTDALWFGVDKEVLVGNYSSIYFYFKCSIDIQIDVREIHNYTIDQTISIKANAWTRIVVEVNDTSFRDGYLSEIGIDHWGTHTSSTSGTWYISSMYGIENYEVIDGVKVSKLSSDNIIDFTAYATPPGRSESVIENNFKVAKEAGFTRGIGLLDGRNSEKQETFKTCLQSYLSSKTTNNKNALMTAIDDFCASINSSNNLLIEKAYDANFKYYALNCILYDFRDFAGTCSYSADDYDLIVSRILDKSEFIKNTKFQGLFYMDEPHVGSDFEYLVRFFKKYQTLTNQEALLNMLPLDGMSQKSNYNNYLNNYFDSVYKYTNYFSFDKYPIMKDGVLDSHLINLEMIANKLKNAGGKDFRTFIYNLKGINSETNHAGVDSLEDLSFQIYSNLAYGSNNIAYYVYSSNNDYSLTEAEDKTDGLINIVNYEKSNVYNYAKAINNEVHSFENAYRHFSWDKAITVGSCTQFNKLETNVSTYGVLTKAESTKNSLIGCFKDKAGNNAFLVTNYQNTNETSDSSTIKLTFNNATHVIVYKDGNKNIYPLTNKQYSFSLAAAHGAFIVPVTAK